ncbi:MAG: 3'-5' exonuclease [Bacteroidetes bacterium]|nr:MAG: 3'-5' exonuclease [Bacteroidota bacterium]
MKLNLERPLAIFDLETTGINITSDRIVEIAIVKLSPDGTQTSYLKKVNPGIPIPPEITAIHGISDDDVRNEPFFKDIALEVLEFIGDADLGGYNSNKFDIPVIVEELMRAEIDVDFSEKRFVDVQNIFHKMEQRTLAAAFQFYCNKSLENAHSALHDAQATLDVLLAQMDRYENLQNDISYLSEFSRGSNLDLVDFAGRLARNERNEMIYNFGKHKGKTVRDVARIEPGYYGWMLDADFPLFTKKMLKQEMEKIKEENERRKQEKSQREEENLQSKLDALKNKFK